MIRGLPRHRDRRPTKAADDRQPFLEPWSTPFEAPPFSAISAEHFGPAFEKAIADHEAEIAAIAQDPRAPDFANTIEALERAGEALGRVSGVFWNLTAADTNDSLQEIERNIAPVLARHHQAIMLDAGAVRPHRCALRQA